MDLRIEELFEKVKDAAVRMQWVAFISAISKNKRFYLILNMPDGEELNPKNMFTGSRLRTLDAKNTDKVVFACKGFIDRHKNFRTELINLAIKNGAIVIDPVKHLCRDSKCPVFDSEGNPLYWDEMHMRASYVRSSADYIDITVTPLANAPSSH